MRESTQPSNLGKSYNPENPVSDSSMAEKVERTLERLAEE